MWFGVNYPFISVNCRINYLCNYRYYSFDLSHNDHNILLFYEVSNSQVRTIKKFFHCGMSQENTFVYIWKNGWIFIENITKKQSNAVFFTHLHVSSVDFSESSVHFAWKYTKPIFYHICLQLMPGKFENVPKLAHTPNWWCHTGSGIIFRSWNPFLRISLLFFCIRIGLTRFSQTYSLIYVDFYLDKYWYLWTKVPR